MVFLTEKNFRFIPLKKMNGKLLFIILVLLWASLEGNGQARMLKFQRSFPVLNQLAVSSDAQGNIYLSSSDGEILKYNSQGNLLQTFSPQSAAYFKVLDASQSMQIMAFDENRQQLVFLDRFLNELGSKTIPAEHFNFVGSLAWSRGNSLWVVDATDLMLKKWRTDLREPVVSLPLSRYTEESSLEIKLLKEHQHRLYLLSPQYAYVFDQLGNYEKQLRLPEWKSATFSRDQLFLLGTDSLEVMNLYTGKQESVALPESSTLWQHLLLNNGTFYLFGPQEAGVYLLSP